MRKYATHLEAFIIFVQFLGLVEIVIWANYFHVSLISLFSWVPADSVLHSSPILGTHSFSDLSSSIIASNNSNPWVQLGVTYTPACMILFRLIGVLFRGHWLLVPLALITLSSLIPFILVAIKYRIPILFGAFIVGSTAFVTLIDRGNIIGLLPVLLFLFYRENTKGRQISAALFLAFSISLKIYPALLIIFLLLFRRYRIVIWTIFFTMVMNFISAIFWGNPILILKTLIHNDLNSLNGLQSNIASIDAGTNLVHVISFFGMRHTVIYGWAVSHQSYLSLLTLILLCSVSRLYSERYWILFALVALQMVQFPAYRYIGCWTFVAIPILLELNHLDWTSGNKKTAGDTLRINDSPIRSNEVEFVFWLLGISMGNLLIFRHNNYDLLPAVIYITFMTWLIKKIIEHWTRPRIKESLTKQSFPSKR